MITLLLLSQEMSRIPSKNLYHLSLNNSHKDRIVHKLKSQTDKFSCETRKFRYLKHFVSVKIIEV